MTIIDEPTSYEYLKGFGHQLVCLRIEKRALVNIGIWLSKGQLRELQ